MSNRRARLRTLGAIALAGALAAACAGQAQRARPDADLERLRRPWAEPGGGLGLRLAAAPPVNRTAVPAVGPWAAEAMELALGELTAYRVKGPTAIGPLLGQSPAGEAYDRFATHPDDTPAMLAAALAIGRAAQADLVLLQTVDTLARDGQGAAGYPAVLAAYRLHLVSVGAGRVVWSQGYATRVEPRTDEAEPAIRWALFQTQREMVARIPYRRDP